MENLKNDIDNKTLSPEEIEKRISDPVTIEYKLVKKFGDKGRKIVNKITNSEKQITLKKLGENVTLKFNRQKQNSHGYPISHLHIDAFDKNGKRVAVLIYNLQDLHVVYLSYIEILDEKYINQGLGSALINELEEIARETELSYINGRFMPLGRFASYSQKFYERNGFKIEYDPHDKMRTLYKKVKNKISSEFGENGPQMQ